MDQMVYNGDNARRNAVQWYSVEGSAYGDTDDNVLHFYVHYEPNGSITYDGTYRPSGPPQYKIGISIDANGDPYISEALGVSGYTPGNRPIYEGPTNANQISQVLNNIYNSYLARNTILRSTAPAAPGENLVMQDSGEGHGDPVANQVVIDFGSYDTFNPVEGLLAEINAFLNGNQVPAYAQGVNFDTDLDGVLDEILTLVNFGGIPGMTSPGAFTVTSTGEVSDLHLTRDFDDEVPELPPGAIQMMVLGLSGVLARFRKR